MTRMRSGGRYLKLPTACEGEQLQNIMTTLSDDLVYDYLKKNPQKYARALAAYENVRIDGFEGKCDSVESGSRMERALKGNTAGYESKIEVMVNDFTSRYGDSKSKNASQSRKKKNSTISDGAKKAAPEKIRNPVESDKEKVDTQKSQIDPFGNASVADEDQESGNDPFGNFSIFGNGNSRNKDEDEFRVDWGGEGDGKGGNKVKSSILGDPGNQSFLDHVTAYSEEMRESASNASMVRPRLISIEDAKGIRKLFFGTKIRGKSFNDAWRNQGFFFTANKTAGFGLVQRNGGPCGVLAAVQACILRRLLFASNAKYNLNNISEPSNADLVDALVNALVDIIMICAKTDSGQYGRPIVALERERTDEDKAEYVPRQTASYAADGLTEELELHTLRGKEEVENFIRMNLDKFVRPDGPGVVCACVSAVLTRGIENCKQDVDVMAETPTLIGGHNYANQELVNLLLSGRARSNIFDGTKDMDGLTLRGIGGKPLCGFLTLFEHFGYVAAGSLYKKPDVNIWVVCSESHYTVLFTMENKEDLDQKMVLELYFYDELASQENLYHLTVSRAKSVIDRSDIVPPLDDVIRTRWPGASVDWNGQEPLL